MLPESVKEVGQAGWLVEQAAAVPGRRDLGKGHAQRTEHGQAEQHHQAKNGGKGEKKAGQRLLPVDFTFIIAVMQFHCDPVLSGPNVGKGH